MFDSANISIFAGSGGQVFAERMCRYMGRKVGSSEVITFSEGNTFVRVNESVRDRDVFLVQPIGVNANNEFVEILFWMDAFKRANAADVTLVMPYFGYAKGDKKDEPRVSIRARVCAECMELAGADRFVTMDLHAQQIQGFFKNPMDHLYGMPMLAGIINRLQLDNMVIVSPDIGYAKQARKFSSVLDLPIAIGDKERYDHTESSELLGIYGDVSGKNALIVDDLTISGGTLCNLATALKARGAKRVFAMLSHNAISERGVQMINASPIETLFATDTVDNPNIIGQPKFKTISVAPMFAETIMRFYNYESINTMFSQLPEHMIKAGFELAGLVL
ncbi:MAG: ribose-phosphate diphosphokinase [Christensenellales bacterium]|jgi:ribose-phosphate pyrophosphokinase